VSRPTVTVRSDPGVNLVGFLEAESGLGEVARRVARVVEQAGLPLALISYRNTPSRRQHVLSLPTVAEAQYDTNILCLNADDLISFVGEAGDAFFAGRYSVGLWFWETPVFDPGRLMGARFLDELWVASEYVRAAVEPWVDLPVHVVPVPVEEPPRPTLSRADLGLPEGFLFLFVFDFVSGERKNPAAVVEAYKKAFAPEEGSVLVLKSINGRERKPRHLENLLSLAADRADIQVRDGYVSSAERDAFIACCDCYVSLHRSEGFGLTLAEAMSFGKPVIATRYSGNLSFMDERSSHLVDFRTVPVPADWWAYQAGAVWAEPKLDHAAAAMRAVFDDRAEAQRLGAEAKARLLDRFSFERSARFIDERVRHGRCTLALSSRSPETRSEIVKISKALSAGAGATLAARDGGVRGVARRILRRLLWPDLAERHSVESSLLDILARTQRSLEKLERRIVDLEGDQGGGDESR
jgi:glycosyltransferase involved in cell wall biosynthesis